MKSQMLDATLLTKLIVIFRRLERNITRDVQWRFDARKDLATIGSSLE